MVRHRAERLAVAPFDNGRAGGGATPTRCLDAGAADAWAFARTATSEASTIPEVVAARFKACGPIAGGERDVGVVHGRRLDVLWGDPAGT